MSAKHHLKTHPGPFRATWDGRKPFEIRLDDRTYAVGDDLELAEWNPCGPAATDGMFTGRMVEARVLHIERGEWGLPPDVVVLGIVVLKRWLSRGCGEATQLCDSSLIISVAGIAAKKGLESGIAQAAGVIRNALQHAEEAAGYTGPLTVGDLEDLASRVEELARS